MLNRSLSQTNHACRVLKRRRLVPTIANDQRHYVQPAMIFGEFNGMLEKLLPVFSGKGIYGERMNATVSPIDCQLQKQLLPRCEGLEISGKGLQTFRNLLA